jgi:hypothetical protein
MTLGALLVRLERYGGVKAILGVTWRNRYGSQVPFVDHPGELGDSVAALFGPSPPASQRWLFPAWTWLVHDLPTRDWLSDRYRDWLRREVEPQASLTAFSMLLTIANGFRDGDSGAAYWSLDSERAQEYAARLHGDADLRRQAAESLAVTLEAFDERAPDILSAAHGIGAFSRIAETANTLRTGSAY